MRFTEKTWLVLCAALLLPSGAAADPGAVRVAICQMHSADGDVAGNLARIKNNVKQASRAGAKICVFPELVDVGFGAIVSGPSGADLARPVPGETTAALGAIAKEENVWIAAAVLEAVPGGSYDTNVLIDSFGKTVLKQRKGFVYPFFGGAPAFQGNFHDARLVDSPWGSIGVMNCVDLRSAAKRKLFSTQQPALMLVSLANPGANLLESCRELAQESGCPVVGANMVWPMGAKGGTGGKSRFCSADGETLWEGASSRELVQIRDLQTKPPTNRRPHVRAGRVQTVRLPRNRVTLNGHVTDDGLPGGTLRTRWSWISGPGSVQFENPRALSATASFSGPGVFLLRLTADDGSLSISDDVAINILPAERDLELVGHWSFDNSATDASEHGNDGVLRGDARYSTDAAPTPFPNSHSLELDGDGDYVRVEHGDSLSLTRGVTVAMWVKLRDSPGFFPTGNDHAGFVTKGTRWQMENYCLALGAYWYIHVRGMGGMLVASLDDEVRRLNKWYHVAGVLDARKHTGKIYINGVLDHTVFNASEPLTNEDPLLIGTFTQDSETMINGLLDDVRVYARVLSDEEIAALVPGAVVNRPPAVDAGRDVSLHVSGTTTLQGRRTDDDHPATSRIARWTRWERVRGPGDVRFGNAFALTTDATFSRAGEYVLQLTSSDGAHLTSDTVKVRVRGE